MAVTESDIEFVRRAFLKLTENFIQHEVTINDLKSMAMTINNTRGLKNRRFTKKISTILIAFFVCNIFNRYLNINIIKIFQETRCLVPNNYFIWEFTRSISNCDYCRNITAPVILPNLPREEFRFYSYSSRPIIIKDAVRHWPARDAYTLEFFRNLYERIEGAYESVEEECQFLRFKSNFANLRDVFMMPEARALNRDGEDPWYVGWKNCHLLILDAMKRYYSVPHFLPDNAEIPYSNYIFMGYEEGAVMHLDYISRLMWQAQVIGSKTWNVAPTPECDSECTSFKFTVDSADIVLLDTRIWYHSTHIENGNFSLTITSEYG